MTDRRLLADDRARLSTSGERTVDLVTVSWVAVAATLPLESFVATPIGNINRVALMIAIGASLIRIAQEGSVRRAPYYYGGVLTYLGWMALSVLWSVDPTLTLSRLLFVGQFVVFPAIMVAVLGSDRLPAVWAGYVAGTTLTSGLLVLGLYSIGPAAESIEAVQARGSLGDTDPNLTADYLAVATVFLLTSALGGTRIELFRSTRGLVALAVVHVVGILITGSRGGLLALGVGVVAFFLLPGPAGTATRTRRRAVVAGLIAAGGLLFARGSGGDLVLRLRRILDDGTTDPTVASRLELWELGWQVFSANPVVGTGFGTYAVNSLEIGGRAFGAHSALFATLSDLGAIGLVALVGMVGCSLAPARRRRGAASGTAAQRYVVVATLVAASLATDLHNKKLFYFVLGLVALHALGTDAVSGGPSRSTTTRASTTPSRPPGSRPRAWTSPPPMATARRRASRALRRVPPVLPILGIQLAATALNLALHRYLANVLGESEYGRYVIALNVVLISILPGSLGLPTISLRLVSGYLGRGDGRRLADLLVSTRNAVLAVSGMLMLACFGLGLAVADNLAVALIAPAIPAAALSALLAAQLRASGAVVLSQAPTMIVLPTTTLLVVFGIERSTVPLSAAFTVAAYLASTLVALALLLAAVRSWRSTLPPREPSPAAGRAAGSREWPGLVAPALAIGIAQVIRVRTGVTAGSFLLTPADVALFAVALRLAQFTSFGVGSVDSWVGPLLSQAHTSGDDDRLRRFIRVSATLTMAWATPVVALLIAFRAELLGLFGPAFPRAADALVILAAAELVNAFFGSTGYVLLMTGRHRILRTVEVAAAGLGVIAALLLMPRAGLAGAAAATATASITRTVLTAAVVAKTTRTWPVATWRFGLSDLVERPKRPAPSPPTTGPDGARPVTVPATPPVPEPAPTPTPTPTPAPTPATAPSTEQR